MLEALAPSSQYRVTAALSGFADLTREQIRVISGQTVALNLTLQVAGLTEAVLVVATTPLVDVTSATTGQDITLRADRVAADGPQLSELPAAGARRDAGRPAAGGNPASRSGLNYSDIGGNVGISTDNVYYFDGINVTDPVTGTFGANLNTEIIQEQKVITGGIPAEFVGAPGLISNVITKSGSNTLHGSANYFFQNDNLVAENKHGAAKTFSTKDSAFTFGGPVVPGQGVVLRQLPLPEPQGRRRRRSTPTSSCARSTTPSTRASPRAAGRSPNDDLVSVTYLSDPTDDHAAAASATSPTRATAPANRAATATAATTRACGAARCSKSAPTSTTAKSPTSRRSANRATTCCSRPPTRAC